MAPLLGGDFDKFKYKELHESKQTPSHEQLRFNSPEGHIFLSDTTTRAGLRLTQPPISWIPGGYFPTADDRSVKLTTDHLVQR